MFPRILDHAFDFCYNSARKTPNSPLIRGRCNYHKISHAILFPERTKVSGGTQLESRQGTAAREPRIRTTNDTVSAVAREQNAQSQPDTMHVPITIFSTR